MVGIGLLAKDCWERNYNPSMILHQAASEALFVAGNFENLKNIIDEQLTHANCLDDKLQAYSIEVSFVLSNWIFLYSFSTTYTNTLLPGALPLCFE